MNETSQRLFDSIRDHDFDFAVCVTDGRLDPPGPHILFVNDHFTKLTGYTPEDVIGKSPRLLQGPKSDREVLTRLKQTLRTGGFFRGQTVNYRKDGAEFLMAWSVSGVGTDGEGPALYLAVQHDAARSLGDFMKDFGTAAAERGEHVHGANPLGILGFGYMIYDAHKLLQDPNLGRR